MLQSEKERWERYRNLLRKIEPEFIKNGNKHFEIKFKQQNSIRIISFNSLK